MIIFGGVEFCKWGDLCHYRLVVCSALIELVLIIICFFFLVIIMVKDRAAVLCAHVSALAVEARRIVNLKKYLQQLIIRDLFRLVHHLYTFSMACFTTANLFVGRV